MNGLPRLEPVVLRLRAAALGLACLAPFAAAPAVADWLVTVDGSRIETAGPWTERGRTIVFESADGDLMSLRASEVDLEASHALTRQMSEAKAPPAPPPAPRASVFRLTDADVGHVEDEDYFAEAGAAGGEPGTTSAPPAEPLVDVTAWDRGETASGDGIEVRATLANQGQDAAISLEVTVAIFDDEGEIIATVPGQLATNALSPGQTTQLTASFPGIFDFTSINFDVRQRALRTRAPEETPEGGEPVEEPPLSELGSEGPG
jgi:hypothetical protein